MSLRILTSLRLADLHLNTAQLSSTGKNLPSDLYEHIATSIVESIFFSRKHKIQAPVLKHHPNSIPYIQPLGLNVKRVVLILPLWYPNITGLKISWV
jgi:hypothetical protein